jgi:pimeloyl-ACP methyl ester carboxylesterase
MHESSAFVEVDGIRMRYHRTGLNRKGPLVLGLGPHHKRADSPPGLLAGLRAVEELAPGFTLDNPCTGDSSDVPLHYFKPAGFVFKGLAVLWKRAIERLALKVDDCILFAHCSGAPFAAYLMEALRLRPRMVVLSCPLTIDRGEIPVRTATASQELNKDGIVSAIEEANGMWRYTLEEYRRIHPTATQADVDRANERAYRVRPLRATELLPWEQFKYADALRDARAVTVLHPEKDGTPLSVRQALADALRAQLRVIPGGRHDPDEKTYDAWMNCYRQAALSSMSAELS